MSEGERPRILCIEDNPVNWRLVQRLLTQAGYEMHWAEEGMKGFDMAIELKPDLLLLDINLPGLSGFEIASKFRAHPDLKYLKIVALTAKTQKADRETALVAGCDGFIPKPIDPFTFVKQVSDYMGGQKDLVDQGREGAVLRQFNAQVLEHLEAQLKEVQDSNRKLLEAQSALELRNRSLGRLLQLSQSVLADHDAESLMRRILSEVMAESGPILLTSYRLHSSGGYWEGLRSQGDGQLIEAPLVPSDHSVIRRLKASQSLGMAQAGDRLRSSRLFDEGVGLGLWDMGGEPCLVMLKDRQNEDELWGFWAITRSRDREWLPETLEHLTLLANMAVTNVENAELIRNLNESSRALASSYERMEAAYQDLQRAKEDLMLRDRQILLEDLFLKIAQRLQTPVACLKARVGQMDAWMMPEISKQVPLGEEGPKALAEMQEAVLKIDGLLRALLRRTQRAGSDVPEWIDLHDLLQQELELLHAELGIAPEVRIIQELQAGDPMLLGVYGDFAKMLHNILQHAISGPTQPGVIRIQSWKELDDFHLAIQDDAGPIPPLELDQAFEPFSTLHQPVVKGIRRPGSGLAIVRQLLASYHGDARMSNTEHGTCVHLHFPLR